jgi:hypothetical protein
VIGDITVIDLVALVDGMDNRGYQQQLKCMESLQQTSELSVALPGDMRGYWDIHYPMHNQ